MDKLVFITQYTDDIQRIFNKHWKLIKNNQYLKQIFPSPPIIAYRANPSLKKKLVRAKLKPINNGTNTTMLQTSPPHCKPQTEPNYPFNLFQSTSQNYRNVIWKNMPILQTTKHQILCHEHKINQKPNRPTASQPILQLPINKRSVPNHMQLWKLWCTIRRIHNEKITREALWAQNSLWKSITKPLLHTQPSTI